MPENKIATIIMVSLIIVIIIGLAFSGGCSAGCIWG